MFYRAGGQWHFRASPTWLFSHSSKFCNPKYWIWRVCSVWCLNMFIYHSFNKYMLGTYLCQVPWWWWYQRWISCPLGRCQPHLFNFWSATIGPGIAVSGPPNLCHSFLIPFWKGSLLYCWAFSYLWRYSSLHFLRCSWSPQYSQWSLPFGSHCIYG